MLGVGVICRPRVVVLVPRNSVIVWSFQMKQGSLQRFSWPIVIAYISPCSDKILCQHCKILRLYVGNAYVRSRTHEKLKNLGPAFSNYSPRLCIISVRSAIISLSIYVNISFFSFVSHKFRWFFPAKMRDPASWNYFTSLKVIHDFWAKLGYSLSPSFKCLRTIVLKLLKGLLCSLTKHMTIQK